MRVYRFRSMEHLLGKYQELKKQTIYFASPDQLNDPMEGFRDIVWRGDKIVWTNFLKHFVYCLQGSYSLLRTTGTSRELGVDDIPFLGRWDQISTSQEQELFDDIWHRFHNLPKMPEIIEALANSNRKIRYRELGFYLRSILLILLIEIEEIYIAHGIGSKSGRVQPLEGSSVHGMLEDLLESVIMFEKIYTEKSHTEEEVHNTLQGLEARENTHRIIQQRSRHQMITQQYNASIHEEIFWKNCQLVMADFPRIYLNEVEKLLWPNWYTACFMEDYHNSSVWGHYAANHRGACLIFASKPIGDSNGLELYYETGKNLRAIRLSEIRYADKPDEIDFFRSIGRLTGKDAKEHWYTDEVGNISECASHIPLDGDMDSDEIVDWRNRHWGSFYRDITVKTRDWEYEQEYRLILEDGLRQFDDGKDRALTYDFNSLKGIIFGIRTSDEHRLKTIEIIQEKCEKHERTDFKYYQAYYSPEKGDIRKYEIRLS